MGQHGMAWTCTATSLTYTEGAADARTHGGWWSRTIKCASGRVPCDIQQAAAAGYPEAVKVF